MSAPASLSNRLADLAVETAAPPEPTASIPGALENQESAA